MGISAYFVFRADCCNGESDCVVRCVQQTVAPSYATQPCNLETLMLLHFVCGFTASTVSWY